MQVWMRKHCLSNQADGFDGFLLTMFSAHLVQQSRLVSDHTCSSKHVKHIVFNYDHYDQLERAVW